MKYLILISLFVLSLSVASFAAQDSAANAGKNTVQKAKDIPAKSQVNQSLEEEDLLIDEAEEKKTAASKGDTVDKKQIAAESRNDSGSAVSKSPGVHADSGKASGAAPGQKSDSAAVVSPTVEASAPVVKHLDTLRAPATIESIHSINFAKNLKNYRSPKVAMFLSLLVPGLGQAYVKKYYKTGVFVAIEATAIGFSIAFNNKGKKQETSAKDFANANYDYDKMKGYYDGLMGYIKDLSANEHDADSAAKAIVNDIFYNDTNLNSFAQSNKYKSQEFYNTIESNTYVQGWKDCQPDSAFILGGNGSSYPAGGGVSYNRSDSLKYKVFRIDTVNGKVVVDSSLIFGYSSNQITFKNMMSKSNSYYKTAQLILITMIINHVISAVDALISAKAYNDELINKESVWRHISIEQQTVDAGSRSIPGCALTFWF